MKKTSDLALENIPLRQQLAIMKRSNKRPLLHIIDRLFWVVLSWFWSGWKEALILVKPDTAVRWHRKRFKLLWKYESRLGGFGRSPISPHVRGLILRMAKANPLWGAPRIHEELLKLGIEISERTFSNLMPPQSHSPPSRMWRSFWKNYLTRMVSMDFFTVHTATFVIELPRVGGLHHLYEWKKAGNMVIAMAPT